MSTARGSPLLVTMVGSCRKCAASMRLPSFSRNSRVPMRIDSIPARYAVYMTAGQADMARKYRLYPSPEQADRLTAWGHTCRTVWNIALEQRQFAWEQRRHTMWAVEQCAYLTQARGELPWLADLPSQSAQQVLRHLDRAYENLWNP